jgi:hypothetical protein
MPERLQRQFDVHAVRIGSHTRFHVLIKCSKCGHEKVLDYAKNIPDEVIAKKLKQWGWLLGRNRANDLCPSCIGVSAENKLANRFKVKIGNEEVPAPRDLVVELEKERGKSRRRSMRLSREYSAVNCRRRPKLILSGSRTIAKNWFRRLLLLSRMFALCVPT